MPGPTIAREPRIDILRGCALVTIVVNHLSQVAETGGVTTWLVHTPTRYGYSTAAELFVILSGYMVGLVYLARPRPARAVLRRAATLWVYNLALLAMIAPLVLVMSPAELAFWRLDELADHPGKVIFRMATLQAAPRLLDILLLYVTLMLSTPVAIAIHRRSPTAVIAASIALYAAAQILTIAHVSASPTGTDDGILKLLSWQVLFFVPMALGARRAHVGLLSWLERKRTPLIALLAVFLIAAAAKVTDYALPAWLTPRYGLHVLRLGHAILVLMLYAALLAAAGRLLRTAPMRVLGMIGRHSLDCFAAGVVVTYAFGVAWDRGGGGHLSYYLMIVAAIIITALVAWFREEQRAGRTTSVADNRVGSGQGN